MASHCTSSSILRDMIRQSTHSRWLPPSFLMPAFQQAQKSAFSTTTPKSARKDGNTRRGMSPIRGTGLGKRYKISVKLEDMPQPVMEPESRKAMQTSPDHGLWGFFVNKEERVVPPTTMSQHGRAWAVPELRRKDFDDLWKLHWLCVREINAILTSNLERKRCRLGHGEFESFERMREIRKTMKAIKHTLTERWYEFDSARQLAMDDPEINLYADTAAGEKVYNPIEESLPDSSPTLLRPTVSPLQSTKA